MECQLISLEHLPLLPEGWLYERHPSDRSVIHVVWPDNGVCSVNLEHRTIELGYCIPQSSSILHPLKLGKGWELILVAEAVGALQAFCDVSARWKR